MRTTRAAYAVLLLIVALLALCLHGCRSAKPKPNPNERATAQLIAPPVRPDTARVLAVKPGLLSGIGQIFSTPAGTANRQAARLARAGVPRKVKVRDGAFSWHGDAVAIGKKAGPAIIKSDSATQQVATNASAGRGNTATQTATETKSPGIGATIAAKLTGPLGWVLAIAAAGAGAYLLYLIWGFIPRRNTDNQA